MLDEGISTWIESVLPGKIGKAKRTFGGGTRATWFLTLDEGPGSLDVVGRIELGQSPFDGTPISLQREAVIYRSLADTEVRIPRLLGEDPQGRALLLERLPGTSDLLSLSDDEKHEALLDFAEQLAVLHRQDPQALGLDGIRLPQDAGEHALIDLGLWGTLAQKCERLTPEMLYTLAWLEAHAPESVVRTVLVQGDTGPGNMMVQDGRVTGLIDWEFAHVGDPHDDIAWLKFRATGQKRRVVDDIEPYVTHYAEHSGIALDPKTLAYYEVFVQLRCAITTLLTIEQGGNLGIAMYEAYHARFVRQMMENLAAYEGLVVPQDAPTRTETDNSALYERILSDLATVVRPDASSVAVKLAVNESISTLRHLRAVDVHGAHLDELNDIELERLTGGAPVEERQQLLDTAAREGGPVGDHDVLTLLVRRARRADLLWADLLA